MKIKVKESTYEEVCALPKLKMRKPQKQSALARAVLNLASGSEIKAVHFTFEEAGMERLGKKEPALFLMNHSSFTDLMIAARMLRKRQYHIVTTNDGFIGKEALMRWIGCIPTKKFVTEVALIKDMQYTVKNLQSSILMFPEASYSFDGSMTPLPQSLGKLLKLMKIPVVMISTKGAFLRDPLYNNLRKRNADVSATMTYLLGPEEIAGMSVDEINGVLEKEFTYDHFRDQVSRKVKITEEFRGEGLHRVLYKCPHCLKEGTMEGKGISIKCHGCDFEAELTEEGRLRYIEKPNVDIEGLSPHAFVTDWYAWERDCVRKELQEGTYRMEEEVTILMLADLKQMYRVGDGKLVHSAKGFELSGCDGKLAYVQKPKASYGLYADYFWYELGDMICIGDAEYQYYCFPKNQEKAIVAKARLAAEELYKIV